VNIRGQPINIENISIMSANGEATMTTIRSQQSGSYVSTIGGLPATRQQLRNASLSRWYVCL